MHPFRAAVEARDLDAAVALMTDDVEFRSPVAHTPYHGRAAVTQVLRCVLEVFENFRYVAEYRADSGHALLFRAEVAGRQLEGCDFLSYDDAGAITALMVMIRPLSALVQVGEAMRVALARQQV